jgi:hypothetical protein
MFGTLAMRAPRRLPFVGPGCAFITAGLSLPLTGTLIDETPIPYNATITGWSITGDVSGSVTIAVSKASFSDYDTMTQLFTASVASAKKAQGSGLFARLNAGDILRFTGTSFVNFTRCNIALTVIPGV